MNPKIHKKSTVTLTKRIHIQKASKLLNIKQRTSGLTCPAHGASRRRTKWKIDVRLRKNKVVKDGESIRKGSEQKWITDKR